MHPNESNHYTQSMIKKIQNDLKEIELSCLDYSIKEKISKLLDYIEQETTNNRELFTETLLSKIKLTRGLNPELNTKLYILYRNLTNDKVSFEAARDLYEMYTKENPDVFQSS